MSDKEFQLATFAGGCFWCMIKPFDTYPGVIKVVSGYTGGHKENPTYAQVTAGFTGHVEAVQITFDPELLSYADLLEMFWRQIDPTDDGGQFADRGSSYKTAIFYHNEQQKEMAEASREKQAERFNIPIATRILPAKKFWPAEDYHQDFYKKNPAHYQAYRRGSGRDAYIASVWGRDEKDE